MSYLRVNRHKLITFVASVLFSFFLVVFMAGAITYIDADSVGVATATPGAAVSVKGAGLFEGFVSADYFTSTSTNTSWHMGRLGIGTTTPGAMVGSKGAGIFEGFVSADYFTSTSTNTSWLMGGNFGLGTTTPGAKLDVRGAGLFDGHLTASSFAATSTTATSTLDGAWSIASSTITIDQITGAMAIGSSTVANADVPGTETTDPALSVFGLGSAFNATGTVYIGNNAGGGGGQIILKSTDGNNCASITFTTGALDPGASNPPGLTVRVVACPK